MTLELLSKVVSPPGTPFETGETADWYEIEQAIGLTLPKDYKVYINTFGTGCFGKFLWVFNPFSRNENLNLLNQIEAQLDALRVLKDEFGEECPYPLHPEPGGLLPWGISDNGDVLFWRTTGSPDNWSVVIHEARGPEYEEHSGGVTGFLRDLILGNIDSQIIPYDFIDRDALFVTVS